MRVLKIFGTASAAALLAVGLAMPAAAVETAKAPLKDKTGKDVGTVELTQTQAGVLLKLAVKGLPAGEHAFHIHAVGKCEPPFESAGEHFNPTGKQHGRDNPRGPHAGDMPNIEVPSSRRATIDIVLKNVSLNSMLDGDGASLVVHENADDYKSDPAGNSGRRIACGVIIQT